MMKLIQLSTLFLAATTVSGAKNGNSNGNDGGGSDTTVFEETVMNTDSTGGGCHTCDCFTCGDVVEKPDGTLDISIDHCKGSSISWICCTALDGVDGACSVNTPGCDAAPKCNGMDSGEFTINVPADAESFQINTHDGKTAGDGVIKNGVCGGPPQGQGGSCVGDGGSAHCLIDFDIAVDCGYSPSGGVPAPVPAPEAPEPEAAEPEAAEPEATEPEATEPEATEPEATEPEATEPEATEPEATEPEATGGNNGGGNNGGGNSGPVETLPGMNLWEWAVSETPWPACDTPGQNESFQGRPLTNNKGECDKINICQGNAGHGWNLITVSRSSLGEPTAAGADGKAQENQNRMDNPKRPNYFPMVTSVPNPNGAGKNNGHLDSQCGFVAPEEPEPEVCSADEQDCEDGSTVTRVNWPDCEFAECPPMEPEPVEPESVDEPEPVEPEPEEEPRTDPEPSPTPSKASGSGDPHFKTWSGAKYDYHGECDLVLVDNPTFADGLGLRVHIRTTRVKYFSYISKVALQIGDDVLEFDNDVENFLINGVKAETNRKHHKTMLGGFFVRRDEKALSVRLDKEGKAKIDFHTRKNGFPAIIVDGGSTDIFKGSLGLLGDWATGKRIARDGETEMAGHDATDFVLEWQVRDTEPMLFTEARFPQFPTTCTPPAKRVSNRLGGSFEKEAEKACAHWKEDFEDCVFDVIATRDVLVAEEGHIVHVE